MRLQTKIFLTIVIPLAILLAVVIRWDLALSRSKMTREAEQDHLAMVETAALILNGELQRAAQVADTVALVVEDIETWSRDEARQLARSIVDRDPVIYGFSFAWEPWRGPSGTEREAIGMRRGEDGIRDYDLVAMHDYLSDPRYHGIREMGQPMWTDSIGGSRIGDMDLVFYLAPILQGSSEVAGVAIADVEVDRLDQLIEAIGLEAFPWLVVDAEGRVLGASTEMETALSDGDGIRTRNLRSLLENRGYGDMQVVEEGLEGKATVSVVDLPAMRGGPRLVAMAPIEVNGWRLCATQRLDDVLYEVNVAVAKRAMVAIVLALLAVLIVVIGTLVVVIRPIRRLDQVVQQVAEGDLDARVEVRGRDELAMLGGALNRLVPRLKELLETRASLSAANRVQEALRPRTATHGRCIDIAGRSRSSEETGGDFFDVIGDDILDRDRTCMMLGDVVGHGLPASLLATTARAYLRGALLSGTSFAEAIEAADVRIFEDTDADRFMVFFAAMHEPEEHRIRVMGCGHNGHILRSGASEFETIEPGGIPLGIDPSVPCEPRVFEGITAGDLLFVASDGAWEARNGRGEDFGIDRLLEVVKTNRNRDVHELLELLFEAVDSWSEGRNLDDDCTILVARMKA